jgi:uncharacterized protein (DUF58 family)
VIPTRRLAALAWIATAVAIVAGYVPSLDVPLYTLDLAICTIALGDLALAAGKRLELRREAAAILSVGRANVVTITVRNRSRRVIKGTVNDDPVPDAVVKGLPASFELPPMGTTTVRYELTPTRRGPRELGSVTARYTSLLGTIGRQERALLPARVDVYPDVHAARALDLLRRQGRSDVRMGSLRVRGGDTEFERLRPYQQGDEVRHIDWRASARRDDPTVRQFQAESNQNVVFALDVGRAMRGESGGITSVDHALNAALLAADVALRGGDKAGFFAFDDGPRAFLAPTGGRAGARKLTRAVHAIEAGMNATDYRAGITFLRTQVRTRSLFVVFTNLLEPRSAKELAASLRGLLPLHLPLCVMMRDTDVESLASAPSRGEVDLYVRAAAAETIAWRDALIRQLRRQGVLVLDAKPDEVTPELVRSYLEIKARRLL